MGHTQTDGFASYRYSIATVLYTLFTGYSTGVRMLIQALKECLFNP